MPGPNSSLINLTLIPGGEGRQTFAPSDLAREVSNFERLPDGTLRAVFGPTYYEPVRTLGTGYTWSRQYGVFHASLNGGTVDLLLIRTGSELICHAGWDRSFDVLATGLSEEAGPVVPDQFCVVNNRVIWTNGVDRALVIDALRYAVPLGFDAGPGAPTAVGPGNGISTSSKYVNYESSWPGHVGTVGDFHNGATGVLLTSSHVYYRQFEDVHGNLSPLSPASNPAIIKQIFAEPYKSNDTTADVHCADIDDLTRQLYVYADNVPSSNRDHVVASLLWRSKDTRRWGATPYLVGRFPGNGYLSHADRKSDGQLTATAKDIVGVPVIRLMCSHQGRLVIVPQSDPGRVMQSETGYPGTFLRSEYCVADHGGSEITGLASYAGRLLAFTRTSVYDVNGMIPQPIVDGIGCAAHRSICSLPDGRLIWLSHDGFYTMTQDGAVTCVSTDMHETLKREMSKTFTSRAVSTFNAEFQEYICAVTPAGRHRNSLMFRYDGTRWSRYELNISAGDICATDDWRRYVIVAGRDEAEGIDNLYVLNRETQAYSPPSRQAYLRTSMLRPDPVKPYWIRQLVIQVLDGSVATFTVDWHKNDSWAVVGSTTVNAYGVDAGSGIVTDVAASAVIGTAKTRDPRLVWIRVTAPGGSMADCNSFAVTIRASYPARLHVASIGFIGEPSVDNYLSRMQGETDT